MHSDPHDSLLLMMKKKKMARSGGKLPVLVRLVLHLLQAGGMLHSDYLRHQPRCRSQSSFFLRSRRDSSIWVDRSNHSHMLPSIARQVPMARHLVLSCQATQLGLRLLSTLQWGVQDLMLHTQPPQPQPRHVTKKSTGQNPARTMYHSYQPPPSLGRPWPGPQPPQRSQAPYRHRHRCHFHYYLHHHQNLRQRRRSWQPRMLGNVSRRIHTGRHRP